MSFVCQECGAPHVIDVVIPSETWNQIANREDMLCVLCIDEKLQAAGLTAEAQFYYAGQALNDKDYETRRQCARLKSECDALRCAVKTLSEIAVEASKRNSEFPDGRMVCDSSWHDEAHSFHSACPSCSGSQDTRKLVVAYTNNIQATQEAVDVATKSLHRVAPGEVNPS